jgi:hypothetical protein
MTFNQILPYLLRGEAVRRKGWYRNSQIEFIEHMKFVQLSSDFGKKAWNPYQEDFAAKDWEIVEGKPTVLGRLFRTLRLMCQLNLIHLMMPS